MPENGNIAVLDAPLVDSGEIDTGESTESTVVDTTEKVKRDGEQEHQDNRRQPDALRKHIADLRRQAEAITDPVEKKAALDRIKLLYDTTGKARGYEEQFPTVREAREIRSLLDSVGGREGVQGMQARLSAVEQNDSMLKAGDPALVDQMFKEAPDGTAKLVPALLDRFAKEKPQDYAQFIAPKSIGFLDTSGFPQAFDRMASLYEEGKTEEAKAIRAELIKFVVENRQQAQQQKQVDPELERLRQELAKKTETEESGKVNSAYGAVVDHAGPAIDAVLKPMIAKLGLSGEQYKLLRQDVWNHIQETRNADQTYKTVAPAKQKQGYDKWTEYAKRWTEDNADASARAMVKARYGHQLQNGAKQPPAVTRAPGAPNVQTGKEPLPSEIDYSAKGIALIKKAGFRDLQDAILSGTAPLKAGGLRKWR